VRLSGRGLAAVCWCAAPWGVTCAEAAPRVEWRGPTTVNLLWTFVAGPILALLPEKWRRARWWNERVHWEPAGTVSGMLEIFAAVTVLGYWYLYEMMRRTGQIMDMADNGKLGPGLEEHQIRGAALTLFYMSPVTWMLLYFFAEGAVRLCAAAFTGKVYGSLPIWIVERVSFAIRKPQEARVAETVKETARSIAASVRERVMEARLEDVEDELRVEEDGGDEVLEIWASRRKADWEPPKTVRVDEIFYRLEESRVAAGPRPFQYRLRKVGAGVMGRTVLQYRTK